MSSQQVLHEKELAEAVTALDNGHGSVAEILKIAAGPIPIPEKILQELRDAELRKNTKLDREGTKFTIPANMTFDEAIRWIERKKEELETEVELLELIEAFPLDGANALTFVLQEMFGISGREPEVVDSIFGKMTFSPEFFPLEIGPNEVVQIPWGQFQLPGIEGHFKCEFATTPEGRAILGIRANIKGKHKDVLAKIAKKVRERLKTHSIYKGKAIKISFRDREGKQIVFNPRITPKFMKINGGNPIFNKSTDDQIELSILNPIRHTQRLREAGIKIKRTVMLSGGYGNGKTLTATQVAREAVEHGWTFITIDNCEDLDLAMKMAEQYTPAIVFAEDADRIMGGERDEAMDALSYVIDGVDTKNRDIMVVLTTNDIKAIQKLMLRPGRIDSVIQIEQPDSETVYRLLNYYGKNRLKGTPKEFEDAIAPMLGQTAAFIAEVVAKAELKAIGRGSKIEITPDDVKVAVTMMSNHVKLMNEAPDNKEELEIPFNEAVVTRTRLPFEVVNS